LVHEYGAAHKELNYVDRFRNRRTVNIDWS
jgi:hypothetical protein